MAKSKTKIKPFKSLPDAFNRADQGEVEAQKCIIGCLENLGAEHLASKGKIKWLDHYRGLGFYINSLVGEYNMDHDDADKGVLEELNAARRYSDDVEVAY